MNLLLKGALRALAKVLPPDEPVQRKKSEIVADVLLFVVFLLCYLAFDWYMNFPTVHLIVSILGLIFGMCYEIASIIWSIIAWGCKSIFNLCVSTFSGPFKTSDILYYSILTLFAIWRMSKWKHKRKHNRNKQSWKMTSA